MLLALPVLMTTVNKNADTPEEVVRKVKEKLEKVNDYEAQGKMKTNVVFIKARVCLP